MGKDAVGSVAVVWDDALASYDFGPQHPLAPIRVELTVELIRSLGVLDGQRAREVEPGSYDEDELLRLHRPHFVEAVKRVSADTSIRADWEHGLGPGDNPIFAGMHEASMLVCAASKEAARLVWSGESDHAFNPAGGLHHAMPDRAAGFCVYNDPAVAIDWLLEHGAERVAYVDVDVHHGDGVEKIFADDPRVLTISLHESGRFLFPGTGGVEDVGGSGARGSAANVPMYPGTTGEEWFRAFDEVVEPLVRAFDPDVLVSQLGCDTHATDPLAHFALTVDDQAEAHRRLHTLAHESADGRWIAVGGGGYQLVQVVPRTWARAFATMADTSVPIDTPMAWRELVTNRTGDEPPKTFYEDSVRISPAMREQAGRAADEAIAAVRRLVLPYHGVHT